MTPQDQALLDGLVKRCEGNVQPTCTQEEWSMIKRLFPKILVEQVDFSLEWLAISNPNADSKYNTVWINVDTMKMRSSTFQEFYGDDIVD